MKKEIDGEIYEVPRHVAVILDGNGRWAKKRFMPRNFGHKAGASAVEQACEDVWNLGIEYFTVYAFSTENWKRSVEEVTGIMNLLRDYLVDSIERSNRNNMKVHIIGDRTRLADDINVAIDKLEAATSQNTGLKFTIALNYGGRDEIRRATQDIVKEVQEGKLSVDDITEDVISAHLDTRDLPDPDLLIRTSGEIRTSNFLPWQIAYSEFYFTDVLWPDFKRENFIDAIKYYNGRDRRYGGVK
ncbi:MAG: isoprenyl transferase [Eubacterium sp.]|nr:isoprenyl transferase [Eubacterium sp.]